MLTELEKYLADNRKLLDSDCPDDEAIWNGIIKLQEADKEETSKRIRFARLIRVRNIAAVIIIFFSIGYITKDLIDQKTSNRQIDLSDFSERSAVIENEYKAMITLKTNEVKAIRKTDDLLIRELFEEIEKLDIVYEQALLDLKQIGYNEKIISTIFDTYEKKIRLLELIILESNKPITYENNDKIRL